MNALPECEGSLLIRTDFSNQQAWEDTLAILQKMVPEGFLTDLEIVDDPAYRGVTKERLMTLFSEDSDHSFVIVADEVTHASGERPLLIVDLYDDEDDDTTDPGQAFRAIASVLWTVEANLSLANMGFEDYADAVDEDGVYRSV